MSTHKIIDKICVAAMVCAVVVTLLFMNGTSLGLTAIVDEDAESYTGTEYFTANDQDGEWDTSGATVIDLQGDTASVKGNGAYVLDGSVYITGGGYYVLTGTLTDGSVVVDAYQSSKVWLLFDGVEITCSDDAGLRVDQADKVFLTLAEGSDNAITSGAEYSDEALEDGTDGAIYAHDDLTINGSGSLTVTANYRHGIEANDDLVITGGTITVTAPGDAINVNDSCRIMEADIKLDGGDEGLAVTGEEGYFYIESGSLDITSGDDGIHTTGDVTVSGGTVAIEAGDDAVHSDTSITVTDGTLNVTACYEGLEASVIDVSGGAITICPTDDGFNAGTYLTISGGVTTITNDSGRDADGLDSNGSLSITGGTVLVSLTSSGSNSAIDYASENGGVCEISGGTVIACGSSGMAESFSSSSEQASILYNFDGAEAGETVSLKDSSGNELLCWEVPNSFNSINISCPEMAVGETYTLTAGDTSTEFTLEQTVTTSGGSGGFGGMAGGFGGDRQGMGGMRPGFAGSESGSEAIDESTGETAESGEMPEMPADGEMSEKPTDGERPEMPTNGEMPEMPADGEMPEMPTDGEQTEASGNPMMGGPGSAGGFPGTEGTGDASDAGEASEDDVTIETAKSVSEFGTDTWLWLIASAAAILAGVVIAVVYRRK